MRKSILIVVLVTLGVVAARWALTLLREGVNNPMTEDLDASSHSINNVLSLVLAPGSAWTKYANNPVTTGAAPNSGLL